MGFDIRRYTPPDQSMASQDDRPGQLLEITRALSKLRELGGKDATDDAFRFVDYCRGKVHESSAQIFQDLFVLYQTGEKRRGFFVEFGAAGGIRLSNTHMLEKQFEWGGILSEPGRCWHDELRRSRGCIVDFRCVWDRSGEQLLFNEASQPEYSTIDAFSDADMHAPVRMSGKRYAVETVSLGDLLAQNGAPSRIDYLSLDTEGSELRILKAFDFDAFDVGLITVEHNFTAQRAEIHSLLTSKGFVRKFEALSVVDDWYFRP